MNKALKVVGIIIIVIILLVISIPLLFQNKIIDIVKSEINKSVNAEVTFTEADLSIFRSFPNATVVLTDLAVVNHKPFEGDTLFFGKTVALDVPFMDIIKSDELSINSFAIDNAIVNILVNKEGLANYDIALDDTEEKNTNKTNEKSSSINIKSYEITNSTISYNEEDGVVFLLNDFNHSGSGDLSSKITKLDTETKTLVSLIMDKQSYLDSVSIELDALLDMDLENKKFSFLENEAKLNQLPLTFDGYVQLHENNQEVAITFKTPSSDFRNFLALVPASYAKDIQNVKTTGNFIVDGEVVGIIDDKHIPKMDISIKSTDASFKFPQLPKSIQNIYIDSKIINTTGLVDDTQVDLKKLAFRIDNNTMDATARITNLTKNPYVNGKVKGILDLADIDKVYPMEKANNLSGVVDADIDAQFDMEAIEKNIVSRIKSKGNISISDFKYDSKELIHPLYISSAAIDLQPSKVLLKNFIAKTGSTDLHATGTLPNLLGFLLADNDLKGNFILTSNNFVVSDFMEDTTTEKNETASTTPTEGRIKIPSFMDITSSIKAKRVLYDNLELTDVSGIMSLKDQQAILKDVNASMFGGTLALNGEVNTQAEESSFDMKLGIKNFDIKSSVSSIEMLNKLAPIATIFEGKLNTTIDLKGKLDDQLSPKLSTIAGDAFAQVLTEKLNPEKSPALQILSNKLQFIDLNKLNLDNIKAQLEFNNGKVNVKPFDFNYQDIKISVGGTHSFENEMNYNLIFDVPAKYLGSDVTKLLGSASTIESMTVPVQASIVGTFSNPKVTTDLESAVKNVGTQLVNTQKDKAVDKLLNKFLGSKDKENVSTTTTIDSVNVGNQASTTIEDTKPKKEEVIKEGVKDILNNILNKKKK